MGRRQVRELRHIIDNTKTKQTYYVNPGPLVGMNTELSSILDIIAKIITGGVSDYELDYYIASPTYMKERDYILNRLFRIKGELIIVCGDYHMADCYSLSRNNKTIQQITTSPISSDTVLTPQSVFRKMLTQSLYSFLYDTQIDDIVIKKKWFLFDYNYLKINNKVIDLCCYNEDKSVRSLRN